MIGIFDSGLGGLTAVEELRKAMPEADFVYFGDTARIPYGTRTVETIRAYALQDCRFLMSQGVTSILIACGTVSTNALDVIRSTFPVTVVGVVEGAAKKFVDKNG
jgi:glutamate racemase